MDLGGRSRVAASDGSQEDHLISPGLAHAPLDEHGQRAHQTADGVIAGARYHGALHFYERIYEASTETLIELIAEVVDENAAMILIIGHNPGLQDLLSRLTGDYRTPMLPATLARIDLDIAGWSKLHAAVTEEEEAATAGRLVFALPPEAARAH